MTGRTLVIYCVGLIALVVCYWFAITAWGWLALAGVFGAVVIGTALAMHALSSSERRP